MLSQLEGHLHEGRDSASCFNPRCDFIIPTVTLAPSRMPVRVITQFSYQWIN